MPDLLSWASHDDLPNIPTQARVTDAVNMKSREKKKRMIVR
jgi:hypothetical protein